MVVLFVALVEMFPWTHRSAFALSLPVVEGFRQENRNRLMGWGCCHACYSAVRASLLLLIINNTSWYQRNTELLGFKLLHPRRRRVGKRIFGRVVLDS